MNRRDLKEYSSRRQLAGVEDSQHWLDHPFPVDGWWRPGRVELSDGELLFRWLPTGDTAGVAATSKSPQMLRRFLGLVSSRDDRVKSFAQDFGPLWLCRHGLPNAHAARGFVPATSVLAVCEVERRDGAFVERVDHWRALSAQASALMTLAADLHRGQLGTEDLWRVLPVDPEGGGDEHVMHDVPKDLQLARQVLTLHFNTWLQWADVRSALRWESAEEPVVLQSPIGVFGALALQMVSRVGRLPPTAVCSGCGLRYERLKRAPKEGQRNFCPDCRSTAPSRLAKRDQRQREKDRQAREEDRDGK